MCHNVSYGAKELVDFSVSLALYLCWDGVDTSKLLRVEPEIGATVWF